MNRPESPSTKRSKILLVEDIPENITALAVNLRNDYQLVVATNGIDALEAISTERPDLILLDVNMPGMDGYEVCRKLKAQATTCDIPVIFITAMSELQDEERGFELGAVDYITKPISPSILRARVKTHLALHHQTQTLENQVVERTHDLIETRRQIIIRLSRAAEYRDNETGNHVIRMSHYSRLIAQAGGLDAKFVDLLYNAAPMHDVGKIGIPDSILLKPGKLDPTEWDIMEQHPAIGAGIIGQHPDELLQMAYVVALAHHEKWDGSGYPNKLQGADIPVAARIVALADVFDALTSNRPYKKAWSVEDALRVIDEGSGKHFDPKWIAPFHAALPAIIKIKQEYSDHIPEAVTITTI